VVSMPELGLGIVGPRLAAHYRRGQQLQLDGDVVRQLDAKPWAVRGRWALQENHYFWQLWTAKKRSTHRN
jgi:hypothetical protein